MSNEINTTRKQNTSNVIQVSNNNAQYYEKIASEYAEQAKNYVNNCATYLSSAQQVLSECNKVAEKAGEISQQTIEYHTLDMENPHNVTSTQVGAYTQNEVDNKISSLSEDISDVKELTQEVEKTIDEHRKTLSGNPHNVTANEVGAYTKSEVDSKLSDVGVDLSGYYTSSEIDTLLEKKANSDLTDTPFQEGNLYVTHTISDTEWSRVYYSNSEKTTAVWAECGGFYAYTDNIASNSTVSMYFASPVKFKNGYFTKIASCASSGFFCSVGTKSQIMPTYITINCTNTKSSASAPNGIWWRVCGVPASS